MAKQIPLQKPRKQIISAELFFKLFVCCLFWQWRRGDFSGMFTTMDKVVHILGPKGLGLLDEYEVKEIQKSPILLGKLKVHVRAFSTPGHMYPRKKKKDREPGETTPVVGEILATNALLVVRVQMNRTISWQHVLRDARIFLTDRGALQAEVWEREIAHLLTREQYLAECVRQEAEFASEAAHASAARLYRTRLRDELKEEE